MSRRKLTPQAAFNKVARHLLRQNERSATEDGTCLYRGPRGLRCAVGALIPRRITPPERVIDEVLYGSLGTKGSEEVIECLGGETNALALFPLLSELQLVHDMRDVEEWRSALADVALAFNLSPAVLEAAP